MAHTKSDEITDTLRPVTEKKICDEAGCETVLSIYNKYEYCALHQPMIIPRMRGTVL